MIILLFQNEDLSKFAVTDEIKPVFTASYSVASPKTRCRQLATMIDVAVTHTRTRQFEKGIQSPYLKAKVRSPRETKERHTNNAKFRAGVVGEMEATISVSHHVIWRNYNGWILDSGHIR